MFIAWGSDSLKGSFASGFQHFSLAQEPSVELIFYWSIKIHTKYNKTRLRTFKATKLCHWASGLLTAFAAVAPGKVGKVNEWVEEVEEGPGDHYDVVDVLEEDHHNGGVADSLEDGCKLAHHWHASLADVLANRDLEEEQGDPTNQHREEVRDQERSWIIKWINISNFEKGQIKFLWYFQRGLHILWGCFERQSWNCFIIEQTNDVSMAILVVYAACSYHVCYCTVTMLRLISQGSKAWKILHEEKESWDRTYDWSSGPQVGGNNNNHPWPGLRWGRRLELC